MSTGPQGLNEDFVRGLPDTGPVVMVNLLRFKPASADGDGSGWDAYLRYSKGFAALMKAVGATILWAGKVEGAAFGNVSERPWEFVVLVRYPSRRAFLEVLTSAEYAKANRHRENGVEDHVILSAAETYSKFPPPAAG
ncbi:MAG: hypothetical protein JWO83_409 [Caulobacteraceae bacterium]|jgi:uncharacterized protein (DUF1330 family)|nr:hypothetical protein [Caulobacteraceae bacterium]